MTEPAAPATIVNDIWSAIQPETLWKGRTGKGVRVAVVDSGIDTEHPDLKGKVKESVEIVTVDGRLEFRPSTSGDQAGHGTALRRNHCQRRAGCRTLQRKSFGTAGLRFGRDVSRRPGLCDQTKISTSSIFRWERPNESILRRCTIFWIALIRPDA